MKLKYQILVSLLFGFFVCDITQAQTSSLSTRQEILGDTVLFQFSPEKNMFWTDFKGNKNAIQIMTQLLRTNKSSIESGDVKVRVLGFCSSYGSVKENLAAAKNRSNQVKSYFIVHEGLKEDHFRTTNSTRRWRGMEDVIAVAYLFKTGDSGSAALSESPQDAVPPLDQTLSQEESRPAMETTDSKSDLSQQSEPSSVEAEEAVPPQETPSSQIAARTELMESKHPYRWALKTNVAYWAATVANLGIEYNFGGHYSIDLPIIYSPYTVARDYQLRFLAIQPEFRYWLRDPMQGHFFGVHLNIGAFNIAVDSKNRYQSPDGFYGIGLSYGYMLPFARRWAAEFTIGAGYVHTKYDSYYNIPNGALYEKGIPYNYWGLTKVGIGLVYRFGK